MASVSRGRIAVMDVKYPLLFEDLRKFTFTTSLCYTAYTATACRLQAEARDQLTHGDDRLTVAKWLVQTAKPRWKINSFLSEISVCWSCTEKITIKTERAFSVILLASPATRRSFQLSPQLPTVKAANLGFNAQLATANARWRLASLLIRCLYVDINV